MIPLLPFDATHLYIRLRLRLAHHGLLQFAASMASSLEIVLALAAPVLLGALALIALPGMLAASMPWPQALALLAGQILLTIAPVWLLRKRLLPADVLGWLPALPIPSSTAWLANAAVAGMMLLPLGLAYGVSVAVWRYQWPLWLRPVFGTGLGLTAAALLLAWLGATALLALRSRPAAPTRMRRLAPAPSSYLPRAASRRPLLLWHQLFWLPFWRNDNVVGLQQTALLLASLGSMLAWLWHPAHVPAALLGFMTSILLVLLSDRGDKAVREQIAMLAPIVAAWPVDARALRRNACLIGMLPGAGMLVLLGAAWSGMVPNVDAGLSHRAAITYLVVAGATQLAIVGLPRLTPRARVALVWLSILILTAIGSEVWN